MHTVNTGQIYKEQIWAQNNDPASSHGIKCFLNKKTIEFRLGVPPVQSEPEFKSQLLSFKAVEPFPLGKYL